MTLVKTGDKTAVKTRVKSTEYDERSPAPQRTPDVAHSMHSMRFRQESARSHQMPQRPQKIGWNPHGPQPIKGS